MRYIAERCGLWEYVVIYLDMEQSKSEGDRINRIMTIDH